MKSGCGELVKWRGAKFATYSLHAGRRDKYHHKFDSHDIVTVEEVRGVNLHRRL